ncbi:MAG: lysophospholipid acyltransferase family protein [Flavobacteriaceae bacterium]
MKYVFWTLWRTWFVIWATVVTILLSPLLFFSLLKDSWYSFTFKTGKLWAFLILFGMGFSMKKIGQYEFPERRNYMYIANHTSALDIMMMLLICKRPIVFVGKKELAKIPLFGYFYRKTCVLVDRSSHSSRKAVFEEVSQKIDQGKSVCIFPEGLVPEDESIVLSPFKIGAFKMAIDHKLDLAPVVLYNVKKHYSFTFFSGKPGILKYEKIDLRYWNSEDSAKKLKDKMYAEFLYYLEQ